MRQTRTRLSASLVVSSLLAAPAISGEITVYSALEDEEIAAYLEAAQEAMPDLTVNVLRLSTGNLGARLIAEAGNPQADVLWGFAVTNILNPAIYDLLDTYAPESIDDLPEQFRDADNRWFAPIGYMGAFCVNTMRLEQIGAPMPQSWADLTDPAFEGEIVMPDPGSSGTGFLQISAILQGAGEEAGWQLIQDLDPNMAQYTTSGSRPCRMAQVGEYTVGASLSFVAMQGIEQGFPLEMVIPSDFAGFELEANALIRGSSNAEDARRFLDWTLSESAAQVYSENKALITLPGVPRSPLAAQAGLPDDLSEVLFPMDFATSGAQRDAIIERWRELVGR
ncbi:ABC transporter substrate-binding protein [Roseinatronobacter alkalisoli]|uniref:ABC transporter substrate-binding protein n=1 Tax=Roseinatronobacter alkalisoli TaxID=3028235 RepID=A0ABT5TFB6_9RHOB|nr:ABC transporter substrate-binding protein [Roseinatronobacter sp. HJB301]MDD7973825.1 ABC transporter substrate-binding protein [Roseinatronobacter sp. HJB301]